MNNKDESNLTIKMNSIKTLYIHFSFSIKIKIIPHIYMRDNVQNDFSYIYEKSFLIYI